MSNANCTKCKFHKGCKNVGIWGRKASRQAKPRIMIIQQAPSRLDDAWNEILSGDGGEKLNWFLESAGIDYNDVYFTSAIKCKPDKLSDITKKTIKACEPFLIEEIIEVQPEIIICMGKAGFQALSGHTSVYNFRGHIQDFKLKYDALNSDTVLEFDTKVMATHDLQGSFSKWEFNDDIIRDFTKVQKYVDTKIIDKTPSPEVNLILSLEALDEWVERYSKVKFATTDFETTGLDFRNNLPFNAGYSHETGKSDVLFILPYKNEHTEKWTIEDKRMAKRINNFVKPNQKRILEAMRKVHGGNTHWILHNGKFDGKFAMRLKIPYKRFWFDTMNGDSLIEENLGHALNIACERRGINFGAYDTKLWKYTNKDEKNKKTYQYVPPWLIIKYLGIDTDACLRLFYKVYKELKEEGMLEHFLKIKMQTARDVMRLEYVGFMADKPLIEKAGQIIEGKMDNAQKALEDFTGIDKFNVNSPQQMNKFMVAEGYPLDKAGLKTNKIGYSTAGDELDKLKSYKKNNCHLFPALVKEFKSMSKIKGTYVDGKYKAESERGEEVDADLGGMLKHIDKNGRIHTNYNLHSPKTSRESSSEPSVQVWPNPIEGMVNCRNFVVPTNKNWCLFEADYCLEGETEIRLANGKDVPIKELVGLDKFHIYTKNMKTGKIDIAEANNARITRRVNKTLELTLNTGKKIRCTTNHKFLKHSEKEFTEAKDLIVGDSLTSARFFINDGEYKKFNVKKTVVEDEFGRTEFSMHKTARFIKDKETIKLNTGHVWDHKDFSHTNDSPDNLVEMLKGEHQSLHMKRKLENTNIEDFRDKNKNFLIAGKRQWENTKYKEKMRQATKDRDSSYVSEMNKDATYIDKRKKGAERNFNSKLKLMLDDLISIGIVPSFNEWADYKKYTSNYVDKQNRMKLKPNMIPYMESIGVDEQVLTLMREKEKTLSSIGKTSNTIMKIIRESRNDEFPLEINNWDTYLETYKGAKIKIKTVLGKVDKETLNSLIRINHKITNIEVIEEEIDVYCITVPEYENFYLSNGVLSHNCAVEINIVAFLSKDPVLLEQLRKGTDLHCFNAVSIGGKLGVLPKWVKYEHMLVKCKDAYEVPYTKEERQKYLDEIEANDPDDKLDWKGLRFKAKSLGFGLNYGKEAFSFAEEFEISEEEAQNMIDGYFATYKVMKVWRDKVVDQALDHGFITLLSGRKRRFYGATEWIYSDRGQNCKWSTNKTESEISRQAMNFPVQGGAHEIFEPALIRLNKRFRKEGLKARIMFRIHDGIVGECPLEERLIVDRCMREELPYLLGAGTDTELQLKVDTDYYKWEWYGEKIKLELDIAVQRL